MEVLDALYALLVESLLIRRGVEIEIATEYFIAAFAAQHHLYSHRLDLPTEEVHWGASAYSRHVVRLEVVDYIRDGVKPFLYGEDVFVVEGPEVMCCFTSGEKVGRVLEADGEGMQLWPSSQRH